MHFKSLHFHFIHSYQITSSLPNPRMVTSRADAAAFLMQTSTAFQRLHYQY